MTYISSQRGYHSIRSHSLRAPFQRMAYISYSKGAKMRTASDALSGWARIRVIGN